VAAILEVLGLPPMPHQQLVFDVGLELENGLPAYREVIVSMPRQCGKTTMILGATLDRSLFWGERQRTVYSAQSGSEGRKKLLDDFWPLIEKTALSQGVAKVHRAQGHERIQFRNGSILEEAAKTEQAGHGLTVDLGIIDEAWYDEDNRREQSMVPAMSTRPAAQLWICSTQGTDKSAYLNRKTEMGRAAAAEDKGYGVAYFEWSIPEDEDIENPEVWWQYHPALGWTISPEVMAQDLRTMDEMEWRRAYGNQRTRLLRERVIPEVLWVAVQSMSAEVDRKRPIVFGVDVHPDRVSAAIAVSDGRVIELVDYREGTTWVLERAKELKDRWGGRFAVDGGGPAAYIADELERAGLVVVRLSSAEVAAACARLYDSVADAKVIIRSAEALDRAVEGLAKRPVGDRFVWSRTSSTTDITPMFAATLALGVAPEKEVEPFAAWT